MAEHSELKTLNPRMWLYYRSHRRRSVVHRENKGLSSTGAHGTAKAALRQTRGSEGNNSTGRLRILTMRACVRVCGVYGK